MSRLIIVGVDGSEASNNALAWGARQAIRRGARVQPVLSWDYPAISLLPAPAGYPVPPLDVMTADTESVAETLMESVGDHLPADAEVANPMVRRGGAGHVLAEIAAETEAEMLVVGSRGLGGFKGLILGSVSGYLANASPCPVAIVPQELAEDGVREGIAVVGVDGSENSHAAIAWADDWVDPEVTLELVHIWQPPVPITGMADWADPTTYEELAERLLDDAAATVVHHLVEKRAVGADARERLSAHAAGADMLIIGARGHRGLGRMLLGSVASASVHHLTTVTVIVGHE